MQQTLRACGVTFPFTNDTKNERANKKNGRAATPRPRQPRRQPGRHIAAGIPTARRDSLSRRHWKIRIQSGRLESWGLSTRYGGPFIQIKDRASFAPRLGFRGESSRGEGGSAARFVGGSREIGRGSARASWSTQPKRISSAGRARPTEALCSQGGRAGAARREYARD